MSSTRHAAEDSELNQERWCSSPEFNHALNAIAVAKRAQLVREPELRALLWFLQWRSLRPNGLKQVAADILTQFPERIGTPAMRRIGCEPGRIYTAAQVREIREESPLWRLSFRLKGENYWGECLTDLLDESPSRERQQPSIDYPTSYPAADFLARIPVGGLVEHLQRICLDPELSLTGAPASSYCAEQRTACVWWFDDLVGALLEYRARSIAAAQAALAATEVSARIREHLGFCARGPKRMVLIEGNPGLGKSVTASNFSEASGGMARYFSMPKQNDDRSFYAALAAAIGVTKGLSFNGQQMKLRVEEALRASGLMLCCDEAQYAWPQYMRPRGTPARMLWFMSMFDEGTSIALIGFKFAEWRKLYLEKTNWPDEQLERRLNRTIFLPPVHCETDLFEIANAALPNGCRASHLSLVSIARINPKKGASAMVEAVATARDLAEQEGLSEITFAVLERAIQINHPEMVPSLAEPAAPARMRHAPREGRGRSDAVEHGLNDRCKAGARLVGVLAAQIGRESQRSAQPDTIPEPV